VTALARHPRRTDTISSARASRGSPTFRPASALRRRARRGPGGLRASAPDDAPPRHRLPRAGAGTAYVRRGDAARSRECFENALVCFRRIDLREGSRSPERARPAAEERPELARRARLPDPGAWRERDRGHFTRVATSSRQPGPALHEALRLGAGGAGTHARRLQSTSRRERLRAVQVAAGDGADAPPPRAADLRVARLAEAREICEKHSYAASGLLCRRGRGDLLADAGVWSRLASAWSRGSRAPRVAPEGD